MLSFEVKRPDDDEAPSELEVYFDKEGLTSLLVQLGFLEEGKTDHVHLMSESWGGLHLAEQPVNATAIPIRHVRIVRV